MRHPTCANVFILKCCDRVLLEGVGLGQQNIKREFGNVLFMGDYYSVSRNKIGIIWIVLAIVLIAVMVSPTRTVSVEEVKSVSELVENVDYVPVTTVVSKILNETVEHAVEENVTIPITVTAIGDISSQELDGDEVAEQQFLVRLDESYKGCLEYTYTFRKKSSIVNIERSVLCFDGDTSLLEVNEDYSGNVEDYSYSVDFDEFVKVKEVMVTETISKPVNSSVVEMEEVITYENVTVVKRVNVSKDVNWILSIFY